MNGLSKYLDVGNLKSLSMYSKAIVIANGLFGDIVDKNGNPYIMHLYSVSNSLDNIDEKTVGLLYGVLEKTDITLSDLKDVGFSDSILDALKLITRRSNESYPDFIDRIISSNNLVALKVKIKDMENKMEFSNFSNQSIVDIMRIKGKYEPQYNKLVKKLGEIK